MRKTLLVFLFSASNVLFACDRCMCKYLFDVIIANATQSECVLSSQTIDKGMIYSKELPLRIQPGHQSKPYTFEYEKSSKQTKVSMSLQCGDDKFITIQSERKRSGFFYNIEDITGMVTAAANLDATFVAKPSQCSAPKAASIYWTLK